MSHFISDERLEIIHLKLAMAIRNTRKSLIIEIPGGGAVTAPELTCVLDEIRMYRGTKGKMRKTQYKMGPLSEALVAMTIGEIIPWPSVTRGQMVAARNTAKKHLNIPDAAWATRTLADGSVEITRRFNGASPRRKSIDPNSEKLANMKVGDIVILNGLTGNKLETNLKIYARRIMHNNKANWKYRTKTKKSIECRRVA